jgi:small subunit ribosomal protein S11
MPPKATTNVKTETVKKKVKKHVPTGLIYIQASFNNTIITFTDVKGNVIAWSTAGSTGFKGSRKGTPFAAQLAAETAGKKAMDAGMRSVNVFVNGPGGGREAALRVFNNLGFKIGFIKDMTPIPHNGCRPAKRRRV